MEASYRSDKVIYPGSCTGEVLGVGFEPKQLLCHSTDWLEGVGTGRCPQISPVLEMLILQVVRISFQRSCGSDTVSEVSVTSSKPRDLGMFIKDCTNHRLTVHLVSQREPGSWLRLCL